MMEAARTSETSVYIYFTRQYPWWWRQHVPLKRRSTIILHGSTPDDGGSTYLWNVGRQLFYTAVPLMMEAARTSETSVDIYFTRQYPWWWQHVPLKRRSTIILQGSTSQKTHCYTEVTPVNQRKWIPGTQMSLLVTDLNILNKKRDEFM
jgi:hypothetical protein